MASDNNSAPRSRFTRDLLPVLLSTVLVVVLVLYMPSALRVPQQDPTPVLEYAPVPPEDDQPPNPQGNLNTLSLGNSNTLEEGLDVGPPPPAPGEGSRPQGKRCVGNPPRQTEDPMAPPCVPYFDGDNGGATWQGVSKDEITVVVYFDVGTYNLEPSPERGTWIDLDTPRKPACPKGTGDPSTCDHQLIRHTRALGLYFNDRFQTYKRRVHYWAYFARGGTVELRKSDAVEIWQKRKPFAVIDQATFDGNNQAFIEALAARNVLVFTSEAALPNSFFNNYPRFAWGFWPDVEHWAKLYTSYICARVAPFPVKRMGNPPGSAPQVGRERVFGLFYTTDPAERGLARFRQIVKEELPKCGVEWAAEQGFPKNRFVTDATDPGTAQAQAVSRFRQAGVTTVLYLGGVEGKFSQVAAGQGYYPEIVIADDLFQGNNVTGRNQEQTVWQNAWATHFQVRIGKAVETPAFQAYRESYPDAPTDEARYIVDLYRDHFMLFQAIQVAGPRLTPESVDRGFHAIPPKASTSPYIASCFFDPADYSCVKDATEIWWDPSGQSPGDGQAGCWRMVDEGKRYLAGTWPSDDAVFENPTDPCTGYDASRRLRV